MKTALIALIFYDNSKRFTICHLQIQKICVTLHKNIINKRKLILKHLQL